jgi:hypothetical protein
MKRYGLLLATLASMAFSAWSLHASGWLSTPARTVHASEESLRSAAWRYHQCHAHHWRNCLLQH